MVFFLLVAVVIAVIVLTALVGPLIALGVWLTRRVQRRPCPRCGYSAKQGILTCEQCGFNFPMGPREDFR